MNKKLRWVILSTFSSLSLTNISVVVTRLSLQFLSFSWWEGESNPSEAAVTIFWSFVDELCSLFWTRGQALSFSAIHAKNWETRTYLETRGESEDFLHFPSWLLIPIKTCAPSDRGRVKGEPKSIPQSGGPWEETHIRLVLFLISPVRQFLIGAETPVDHTRWLMLKWGHPEILPTPLSRSSFSGKQIILRGPEAATLSFLFNLIKAISYSLG